MQDDEEVATSVGHRHSFGKLDRQIDGERTWCVPVRSPALSAGQQTGSAKAFEVSGSVIAVSG